MNEQAPLTNGQRIASLRQFFRSRRVGPEDAQTGSSHPADAGAASQWLPTEWPQTQWGDTCIDPPALED